MSWRIKNEVLDSVFNLSVYFLVMSLVLFLFNYFDFVVFGFDYGVMISFCVVFFLITSLLKLSRNGFLKKILLVFLSFRFLKQWYLSVEKKDSFVVTNTIVKYGFLILLFLITLISLKFEFLLKIPYFETVQGFLISRQLVLTIITIVFGFFTFWFNRERVEKEIEDEQSSEEKAELKRGKDFNKKFPWLSWFNFSYGISESFKEKKWFKGIFRILISPLVWFARLPYSFVKWMYKEGWWYSVGLICIVLIGFVLRVWNIMTTSYNLDEGIYYILFENLSFTSLPQILSGALYLRNFIYTYTAFFVNYLIKNVLLSLRLISLIAGIGLIILVYFFVKRLTNKFFGIFSAILIAVNGFLITYSIQGRHYMMMYFIYILFIFLIIFKNQYRINKIVIFTSAIILSLNFEFIFLILPTLFFIAIKKKRMWIFFLFFLIIVLFFIQFFIINKSMSFGISQKTEETNIGTSKPLLNLNINNSDYIEKGVYKAFQYSQPIMLLILIIFLIGAISNKLFFRKITKKELNYIFLSFIVEVCFFSFVFLRDQIRYRGTMIIISIIFLSIVLFSSTNHKNKPGIIIICILIYLFLPFNINYPFKISNADSDFKNNAELTIFLFNNTLGYYSIHSNGIFNQYSVISELNLSEGILISTDLYNIQPYNNILI